MPDYLEAAQNGFSDTNEYPIDSRGLIFTFAFFTRKHLGEGQFYLMTVKDKEGDNFDGGKTYRLTVPANAPSTRAGRSRSSSVVATAKFQTAYRPCRAGTTWCASIVHAPKS